jgi:proteasome lid subunit RPN8/RPN11
LSRPAANCGGPSPPYANRCGGRQLGKLYRDAPIVVVSEAALETILAYSDADTTRERGGFLLGSVLTDEQTWIAVKHFHPATSARGDAASLTFTHETWAAVNREIAAHFPDEMVVGWHHTHPGLGAFLSGYDRFIQENFFREPWHIALVVDPRQRELVFYHWRGGAVRDCGFVCVEESLF